MTNEEYIEKKKEKKFEIIWDNLIKKIPKTGHTLDINECAFNLIYHKYQECYIVCQRTEEEKKRGSIIYLNKDDVKHIFYNYEEFVKEIKKYKDEAYEGLYERGYILESDFSQSQKKINKVVRSLMNKKYYVEILIKLGGGSLKVEREISQLPIEFLHKYVIEKREEKKFKYIYFEFKEYGIERISKVISRKSLVRDILIEESISKFLEFCINKKIKDIYDLLLLPYYSSELVDEFGNECIENVINAVKTFIELQTLEYTNVALEDFEY